MSEIYKYLYTQFSVFGSLPTHKVFISSSSKKTKLVLADNTFIYGTISDWAKDHSGLDSRTSNWSEEPELFLESEKRRLSLYKSSHPDFITESGPV
ncbi:hypothetical protein [Acinetobacter sp. ANC 3791]|uniref:hypothetical protein n=1 Tax=Acinetobacter sp. ANC 3791 TaxID=2529836 RepID=UPI00103E46F1|nr:hypothetical protein [Acinetobacter sp. ANC 3791]TCB86287.1 hypothetical protein E0H90_00215 [Acinetobacter sp. ANC 3791]